MLGFIFTRCVKHPIFNEYWIKAYKEIRKLYPDNLIVIIDDNSNKKCIKFNRYNFIKITNTIIIESEFPGRAELLPYYYLHKYKWFDKAVILFDSMFMTNQYIDFDKVEKIKFLYHFNYEWNMDGTPLFLIEQLKNGKELLKIRDEIKDTKSWIGCFGTMSIITTDFLDIIAEKYELSSPVLKGHCSTGARTQHLLDFRMRLLLREFT